MSQKKSKKSLPNNQIEKEQFDYNNIQNVYRKQKGNGLFGKKKSILVKKNSKSQSLIVNSHKKKLKMSGSKVQKKRGYFKNKKKKIKPKLVPNKLKENLVNLKNRKSSKSLKKLLFRKKFTTDNIYSSNLIKQSVTKNIFKKTQKNILFGTNGKKSFKYNK